MPLLSSARLLLLVCHLDFLRLLSGLNGRHKLVSFRVPGCERFNPLLISTRHRLGEAIAIKLICSRQNEPVANCLDKPAQLTHCLLIIRRSNQRP